MLPVLPQCCWAAQKPLIFSLPKSPGQVVLVFHNCSASFSSLQPLLFHSSGTLPEFLSSQQGQMPCFVFVGGQKDLRCLRMSQSSSSAVWYLLRALLGEGSWQVLQGTRCWWRRAAGITPGGAPWCPAGTGPPPWEVSMECSQCPAGISFCWCHWVGLFQVMSPLLPHPPWGQCDLGGCCAFSQALLTPFSILCWPWAPGMGNVTRTGSVGPWNQHPGGSWAQAQASYGLVVLLEEGEVHLNVVRLCAIPSSSN